MNIYSLYYTHKPGGFCKRLYRLLNALDLAGHQVTYLSLDNPPSSLNSSISWKKIPFPLSQRNGLIFWTLFSLWSTLYCLWFSYRHSTGARWVVFSPFYATILAPVKMIFGLPIICFIRSKLAPSSESKIASKVEALTQGICFEVSDKVILQTKANLELAKSRNLPVTHAAILPNNIDKICSELNSKNDNSRMEVISSGVFTKKKNLEFLFNVWRALAKLSAKNNTPCPHLTIIGIIRDTDSTQNLPENISLVPWSENLGDHYKHSDIYLHPSLHEGMPNSVLEAMGAGLVTLVANIPELLELVGDENLSFDVKQPEALAQKLLELQLGNSSLIKLRKLTLIRAKELCFDWDKAASELAVN